MSSQLFFFFQAEDGIRDLTVTGVQTCALPIVTQRKSEVGIDYRLHLRDSRWQVYDMLIDGVSFVSTYRSQFDRVIQAESYGALVERLRKRNLDTAGVDRKKL